MFKVQFLEVNNTADIKQLEGQVVMYDNALLLRDIGPRILLDDMVRELNALLIWVTHCRELFYKAELLFLATGETDEIRDQIKNGREGLNRIETRASNMIQNSDELKKEQRQ